MDERLPNRTARIWIALLMSVLLISIGAAVILSWVSAGTIATVTQEGQLLYTIDLRTVTQPYTIHITGKVENVIAIEKGRISIQSATCPDQVCVHQGWISDGITPIVCLPNGLVIVLKGKHVDVDVIAS